MPVATARARRLKHLLAAALLAFAALFASALAGFTTTTNAAREAPAGPPQPAAHPLQPWIDATPAGGTLRLMPGTYSGPAEITRAIVLDGGGEATIDGGGHGTVLALKADGATLRGLRIVNSGESHDRIDSGLLIEGSNNLIEDNIVENVLFGITLHRSNDNVLRHNRIRSMPWDIADRGDGIRLWYSLNNLIADNDIAQIRDITVTNAPRNRFVDNTVRDSRRAMNFLFSHRTLIEGNTLSHNATGITILNSEGMLIRRNRIMHAMDASGAGIALKESSASLIHDNDIVHCAVGVLADSPLHALNRITILDNRLSHNVTGITFYGERGGRLVINNRFEHNLWQATVGTGGDDLSDAWYGNYWDDYEGFDRNHDGVGDQPYEILAYADRIWLETPKAKFFRSSPVLELLDFLERLAPFSHPTLVLRDPAPVAHGFTAALPR